MKLPSFNFTITSTSTTARRSALARAARLSFPWAPLFKVFETLVLSWTTYPHLANAQHAAEFDAVLRMSVRDIKFHCETVRVDSSRLKSITMTRN